MQPVNPFEERRKPIRKARRGRKGIRYASVNDYPFPRSNREIIYLAEKGELKGRIIA